MGGTYHASAAPGNALGRVSVPVQRPALSTPDPESDAHALPTQVHSPWQTVRETLGVFFRSVGERHLMEAAGSIAFRFFLSTVPLLVFVGFLIGRIARTRGIDDLIDPISEIAPTVTDDLLRSELSRLSSAHGTGVAPLSIVSFLWMVSSGAHNLQNVFGMVFKALRRPWWLQRMIALAWTLGVVVLVVGATWARMEIDVALHPEAPHPLAQIIHPAALATARARAGIAPTPHAVAQARHVRERKRRLAGRPLVAAVVQPRAAPPKVPGTGASTVHDAGEPTADAMELSDAGAPTVASPQSLPPGTTDDTDALHPLVRTPIERALSFLALLALATSITAVFYRYAVRHPPHVRRRAWPGALLAVLAWMAMSWGFGFYMRSLDRYTVYYGSLAAVAVLQLWLFFTSVVLLLGGQVNAMLEARDGSAPQQPASPPPV